MDRIYLFYTVEHYLYVHHFYLLAQVIRVFIRVVFSADVPPQMQIGKGTTFPHDALGCVFHPAVVIGKNCKILHGVTMGGRSGKQELPIVGDNVLIGVHAQLCGNIKIGDNAIVGAGAIVVKDVPENAVVVGNPAKIIKYQNKKINK